MKISEMNNEQAAEALIRLSVPFGNICEDEKTLEMINSFNDMSKAPLIQTVGKLLPQIVGHLLKTHKSDLFEIVGALTFKTPNAVAKMNFLETVQVVKDSYDSVLNDFFTSTVKQTNISAEE